MEGSARTACALRPVEEKGLVGVTVVIRASPTFGVEGPDEDAGVCFSQHKAWAFEVAALVEDPSP